MKVKDLKETGLGKMYFAVVLIIGTGVALGMLMYNFAISFATLLVVMGG